jgi:hypothetical protein
MNMKEHILAAMREQFENWENLLTSLSEEQLTSPNFDLDWSIQDMMAHLWGWQQISIARMEAALHVHELELPQWIRESGAEWEEDADQTNSKIYENFHNELWSKVYKNWRDGYLRFLKLGEAFSERDLLDGDKYLWLRGFSLAFILIASYEHHQEHIENLTGWLQNN